MAVICPDAPSICEDPPFTSVSRTSPPSCRDEAPCAWASVSGTTAFGAVHTSRAWAAFEGGTCSGPGRINIWLQDSGDWATGDRHPAVSHTVDGIWIRATVDGCGLAVRADASHFSGGSSVAAASVELVVTATDPVFEAELVARMDGWDVSGELRAPFCEELVTGCP